MKKVKIASISDIKKVIDDNDMDEVKEAKRPISAKVKQVNKMAPAKVKSVVPMKFDASTFKRPIMLTGKIKVLQLDDITEDYDEGDLDNQRAKKKK